MRIGKSILKHHEVLKNIMQALGFLFAGLFFAFKLAQGFMITEMTVSLSTGRASTVEIEKDFLAVNVNLRRGNNGSLKIIEMWAKIYPLNGKSKPILAKFKGFERTQVPISQKGWLMDADDKINLPPGEATQFTAGTTIDADKVYAIEILIDGQRKLSPWRSQWKASTFSLPLTE